MMRTMLKSKIHRATVTQADLHYVGSVTIDEDLLDAADLLPGEQVAIVDVTNGARLETYVIPGERGTGVIGINGAAAHLVHPGDLVIMISYGVMDETEAKSYIPKVVHVDGANRIVELGGDPSAPVPGARRPAAQRPRRPDPVTAGRAGRGRAADRRHRQQPDRPRHVRRRAADRLLAGHHVRRAPPPTSCGCSGAGLLRDTEITGVAACSTVPALLPALRQLLDSLEVPVVLIGPGVRTGVPLHVDNPREVGADRVVTALAAHELFGRWPDGRGRPVVVVDFGTSTNVDAVGPDGQFLGGALAPGVEVSLDALATRAAQLRSVELTVPPQAIGKNTVAALQSGLVLGFAGLVDGLVARIAAEIVAQFGAAPVVVATGGLAPLVVDSCRSIGEREPDLTVHGLRLAFERHQAAVAFHAARRPPVGSSPRE